MMALTTVTTNSMTAHSDSATTMTNVDTQLFEVGSTLFYIVIGAGSGVLVLLLVILVMCAAVCYLYLAADRGKSYTITTESADTMYEQLHNGAPGRENSEQQWQSE